MRTIMINTIQKVLGLLGFRVERVSKYIEPVMPFDVLELAIVFALKRFGEDKFYFVQIGANDGILNDFLNPLIRRYKLRGCLVEPMPDVFDSLKRNYADQPQLEFRNVMIGERDGDATIYRFRPNAAVPRDFYHGLARQDGTYIRRRAHEVGLESDVESLTCSMQSFGTLLDSIQNRSITLLYIDTEGSDDAVIRSALEAGIQPYIIQYEWTEMSLDRRYALKHLLLSYGYRFLDIGADTICVRVGEPDVA